MDIEAFLIARFEPASFFSTQISIQFSNSSFSDALDRLCFFIDYYCLLKFPYFLFFLFFKFQCSKLHENQQIRIYFSFQVLVFEIQAKTNNYNSIMPFKDF
jgi:hypothetical protein